MAKRDYYEVLGVSRSASEQELKSAYRKLAHKFHPDKNPDDQAAEESFKEVNEAYEVLSNPERREAYDRFGHDAARMGGFGGGGDPFAGASINDIFGDIFGEMFGGGRRGRQGRARQRGADLRYNLDVSFEEAAFGTEARIRIPRHKQCESCTGSGAKKGTAPQVCTTCSGMGEVRFSQGFFSVTRPCHECHGEGRVIAEPCLDCRGRGKVAYEASLSVNIPPGVDHGVRLRVSGEGDLGDPGAPPGDLYVVILVKEHPIFARQNDDVVLELPISFAQAALGGKLEVPTLDGRVELTIPAGTQNGRVFRMRGLGVPHLNGRGRGDQHVQVTVEVPRHLSRKQRDLLEQFAASMGEGQSPRSKSFFDKVKEIFGASDLGASDVDEVGESSEGRSRRAKGQREARNGDESASRRKKAGKGSKNSQDPQDSRDSQEAGSAGAADAAPGKGANKQEAS